MKNGKTTNKYLLHYRQDFSLSFIDFIHQYTMYGKVEYICLFKQDQGSFSAYLSEKGLRQASWYGKKKILENALWQDLFTQNEKYFRFIDELKDDPIPELLSAEFLVWWNKILKLTKIISDVYFYCDEPMLASLEEKGNNANVKEMLYYIGKFKLRAHERLSILDIKFNELLKTINCEYLIPLSDLKVWTFNELNEYVKNGYSENFVVDTGKRKNGYVYLKAWAPFDSQIYSKWEKKLEPKIDLRFAQGTVAFKSKENVRGRAKIHFSFSKADELPKDSILVTGMTNPQLVPYLKNIKGIITDEGGLMCHAAIISRELKIPCIVGTRKATQIFKDGIWLNLILGKGWLTGYVQNH